MPQVTVTHYFRGAFIVNYFKPFIIPAILFLAATPLMAAPPVNTPAPAGIGELAKDAQDTLKRSSEVLGESTIDRVEVDKSAQPKAESQISKEQRFVLQSVSVLGNETLKPEDVIAVVKPYVGTTVGVSQLNVIAQEITKIYTRQGYVTSRCVIPQQEVKNGVVTLQLIEDKLRGIALSGKSSYRYNPSLFAKHFHDMQGKIININELNKRLLVLQRLPATHITPVLKKSALNLTDLVLQIADTADVNSVSVANGGSQFTDKNRVMVNSQINNMSGNGDRLSLNLTTALHTPKYFNSAQVGYLLPVGEKGGRLSASANVLTYKLDPNVIGTAISDFIRYRGSSTGVTLGYEQPFLIDKGDFWWGLGVERQDVRAQTVYNQKFLTFNAGDLFVDSQDKLFVASATLHGNLLDEVIPDYRGYTSFSFQVKHALEGMLGSMTTEDIARKLINVANAVEPVTGPIGNVQGMDPRFWKFYLALSRTQAMPWNSTLRLGINGEYTQSKKIPSSYDFIGADNGSSGIHFDAALSRPVYGGLVALVGYKADSAISYYRDLSPGCNGTAIARGRNQCTTTTPYFQLAFRNDDLIFDVKYESHIALYEQSQEKFKASASYLW